MSLKRNLAELARRTVSRAYGRLYHTSIEKDMERLKRCDAIPGLEDRTLALEQKLRCASILLALAPLAGKNISEKPSGCNWQHEEIFILGSGASLNLLSANERDALAELPTLAMNKYLLYWDIFGVWPTYSFLADTHYPASEVLTRSVEALAQANGRPLPRFILSSDYATWPLAALDPIYFKRNEGAGPFPWAESMEERMYFHRGSLTCLLNLITVLRFAPKVTLLGVDLGNGTAFYQERYDQESKLHDYWETTRKSTGAHPTAVEFKGIPPIQDRLPWVFEKMRAAGISVSTYNPESLLAKMGSCPTRSRLA